MRIKKRNSQRKHRIVAIALMLATCSFGLYLILSNLNENIVFFYPPSEISKIKSTTDKVRIGGIVKENSIINLSEKKILFTITDYSSDIQIEYEGMLPTLFREKQGIVAEGKLVSKNLFIASKLLAKHDENYRPPELRNIKQE
jgi:cytochrome c-type biogenesis protein CcmE